MCLFPFCPQFKAFQVAVVIKNLSANAGDIGDMGLDSWVKKIPLE